MSLKELQRKKNAKEKHFTRACDLLNKVCTDETIDYTALTDATEEFDKLLSELDSIQEEIELKLSDEFLDKAINEYIDFKESKKVFRLKATKTLKNENQIKHSNNTESTYSSNSNAVSAKLPKIVLPTFSGDVKTWMTFWDQFKVLIHEADIPTVTKFTYLISVLKN